MNKVLLADLASRPALNVTTDIPEVSMTHSFRISIIRLGFFKHTADRDRTVLQRSKPNSRTTLMGEQPNP